MNSEIEKLLIVQKERDELLKKAKDITRQVDNKIENLLRLFFEAFSRQLVDDFSLRMSRISKDSRVKIEIDDAFSDLLEENHVDWDIPYFWDDTVSWMIKNNDLVVLYTGGYPHEESQEYEMTFDISASTIDQLMIKFENASKKWKEFLVTFEANLIEKHKPKAKEIVKDLKKKIKSLELKLEEIENNNRGNY